MAAAGDPLPRLRAELAAEGLHIVRPVTAAAVVAAGMALPAVPSLPRPRALVVVGDGGGAFYARFRAAGETSGRDPLDRYTARVVGAAVARALAGVDHAVVFPFLAEGPPLPLQRIGVAAGLPPAGPLGLQVHPVYGPWWAYRAIVALGCEVTPEPPLASPCAGCAAPCATACPGEAVATAGFRLDACVRRRAADPGCQLSCAARLACVAGPQHRYPDEQLAFHMRASLVHIRRA